MNAAQMLELMNRTPFETFEVRLSDGARLVVEHPWQIATAPNSAVCVIFEGNHVMRIVAYRNVTEVITSVAA